MLLGALAVVPAVTAQGGDGDNQDSVTVCHFADGAFESAQAPETDFYGANQQGHARHAQDIVPPFVVENPRPGDPSSFDGRNRDERGQRIYDAGCVESAPDPVAPPEPSQGGPPTKVRICHATSSSTNPYTSPEPAIANNGDLHGGHLDHTGPVYPADNWGDIIPPYVYVDQKGVTQSFPGYNWTEQGQAIWQNKCEPPLPPAPKEVTPILECVEPKGDGFLAHWGYDNPNGTTVEVAIGALNEFTPGPPDRGQGESFAEGRVEDAFQTEFDRSLTWNLTGNAETATRNSTSCGASITVTKRLVPSSDPGRFSLKIDSEVAGGAETVGDNDSTGTIAVAPGGRTVSETAARGTQLQDYTIQTVCRTGGGEGTVVASGDGPSLSVNVGRGQALFCVITNTRKPGPGDRDVRPVLECVLFNDGAPDIAYWGYLNTGEDPVTVKAGTGRNRFSPGEADQGQPSLFEAGRQTGVFDTPFQAESVTLVWSLLGRTATASDDSPACNPTVELRKVSVPADDPGVFQLRINGAVVATGGNGTTSGPLRTGIGEGTVTETAGPGTNLADYDSRVECTRNGTVEVSVPGTKVDGEVAARDTVVCTFTNTRKGTPPQPPTPPTPRPHPRRRYRRHHRRHRPRPRRRRCLRRPRAPRRGSTSSSRSPSSRRRWPWAGGSPGR